MNDRVVLVGVFLLIANMFVLFAGLYSFNYYVFVGVLAAGVFVALAGAFIRPSPYRQEITAA
ncbi:MAG: hypothetical protein ACYC7D_14465 [Nitrososphaerales archaeon]